MRNVSGRALLRHTCAIIAMVCTSVSLTACSIETGVPNAASLTEVGNFTGITAATVLSPSTIKISWNLSSNYSNYDVYTSTSAVPLGSTIFSSYMANGLTAGTAYTFSVAGTSRSTRQIFGLNKAMTVNTWPVFTGLSAVMATSSETLQATWSYPVSGPTFKVYVKQGSTFTINDAALTTPAATTTDTRINIAQLSDGSVILPNTTYYVLVRATFLDDTTEFNGNIMSTTTPSNISPIPIVTIDNIILGRWPAFNVLGGLPNYVTTFKKDGITLGSITGDGTFQVPSSLPLDLGLKTIDVTLTYLGNSIDLESHDINARMLGDTLNQAPNFKNGRGYQRLGYTSAVGDFNCDGYQDLALGAPDATTQPFVTQGSKGGAVYVFYGSSAGLKTSPEPSVTPATPTDPLLLLRPKTGSSSTADIRFGKTLAAGNINADRIGVGLSAPECDDLAIGTVPTSATTDQGEVWIFFGSPTGPQQGNYVQNIPACSSGVCSPLLITPPPGAWRSTVIDTVGDKLHFGASLAIGRLHKAADGNDTYRDIIIGVPGDASGPGPAGLNSYGAAWIYYGSNQGINFARVQDATGFWEAGNRPFTRIYCPAQNATVRNCGLAVAVVNLDNDVDKIDDLVIGAPYQTVGGYARQGAAFYFSSKTFVGNPPLAGETYDNILPGSTAPDTFTNKLYPQDTYMWFGGVLANVGDLNGDGVPDLAISSGTRDATQTTYPARTEVAVIYGSTTGPQTGSCKTNSATKGAGSTCDTGETESCDLVGNCSIMHISISSTRYNYYANSIATNASNTLNETNDTKGGQDVNGDGYADLLLGTPMNSSSNSAARLYYGDDTGVIPAQTIFKPITSSGFDEMGGSVAIGDFNSNGRSDIAVSAPSNRTLNGAYGGVTYIFNGSAGGFGTTVVSTPNQVIMPNKSAESYAFSALPAGDINGDGFDDVIAQIYHPLWTNTSQVSTDNNYDLVVYFGGTNGPLSSIIPTTAPINATDPTQIPPPSGSYANFDFFGPTGDINGDGYADIVAYSSTTQATYIYFGSSSGLQTAIAPAIPPIIGLNPVIIASGNNIRMQALHSSGNGHATTYGDFNADGFSDVVLNVVESGTPFAWSRAIVVYGSSAGPQTDGVLARPNFTTHAASTFGVFINPCDPTGDPDPICKAQWLEASVSNSGVYYGYSIAALGDIDGDGYGDLAVGDPMQDVSGSDNGGVYVYFGGPNGLETWNSSYTGMLILPQVLPTQTQRWCGSAVGYGGDINGDGFNELVIGCYGDEKGGTDYGSAIIFYGCGSNRHTAAAPAVGCSLTGLQGVAASPSATVISFVNTTSGCGNGSCLPTLFYPKAIASATSGGSASFWGTSIGSPGDVNSDGYDDIILGTLSVTVPCTNASCPGSTVSGLGAAVLYTGTENGLNSAPNTTRLPSCAEGVCAPYLMLPPTSDWGASTTPFYNLSFNSNFNKPIQSDFNNDSLIDFLLNTMSYKNSDGSQAFSGGFYLFQ